MPLGKGQQTVDFPGMKIPAAFEGSIMSKQEAWEVFLSRLFLRVEIES